MRREADAACLLPITARMDALEGLRASARSLPTTTRPRRVFARRLVGSVWWLSVSEPRRHGRPARAR